MQFGSVDGFLYVARVTGPTHGLLQLKLSKTPSSARSCDELHATGDCNQGVLDPARIAELEIE